MTTERLWVLLDQEPVADLDRVDDAHLAFTYRPEVVERDRDRALLSISLPVRAEPYADAALLPFFEGLLPEGSALDRVARTLRLDPGDVFGLLREIGRDCAGAVSVVPEGTDLRAEQRSGTRWLDENALARHVRELTARPLAIDPAGGIRLSLAGAQDKMVVVVAPDGRIGLPRGTTPSTHILKPASLQREPRSGDLLLPALVANELFCTLVAHHAGVVTVNVSILSIEGSPALLIERYDRTRRGDAVQRIHQEDMCQALAVRSFRKYEEQGGPGIDRFLRIIRRWSVDVATDQDEMIDRIALCYLIGNADAHAKNFSLLHAAEGIRVAPAYDLLSTHVYGHLDKRMATAINGLYDPERLRPIDWKRGLTRLHLSAGYYADRLSRLADRVEAAIPRAREDAARWDIRDDVLGRIASLVSSHADVLRGVRTAAE